MTPARTIAAYRELARTSPPWVGSRIDRERNAIIRHCKLCHATAEKKFPKPLAEIRSRGIASESFDDELFRWMRDFAQRHRKCGTVAT